MSKSKGNVINPHGVIEEFGSDALRMGMLSGRSAGDSAAYAPAKIVAGRNFANKLWNTARFVEQTLDKKPGKPSDKAVSASDHWMLRELQHTLKTTEYLLNDYRLSEAYENIYHFVWDIFADWYIEASKREVNPGLLRYTLEAVLKISHPFTPFVTETIWQTLDWTGDSLLISQQWPVAPKYDDKQAQIFEEIRTIVTETRMIISQLKLRKTQLFFTDVPFLTKHAEQIAGLARIEGVHEVEDGKGLHLTTTKYTCWLDVDRETTENYTIQLKKQLQQAENKLEGYKKRLSNKSYIKQAPKHLVEETKTQQAETELLIENIKTEIVRFSSIDK